MSPTEARTISELLERAAARWPEAPALHHRPARERTTTLTFTALQESVERIAARLSLALPPGSRLLLQGSPSPALAALYLAAARVQVILVPLDVRMSPETVARIAGASAADALLLAPGASLDPSNEPTLRDLPRLDLEALAAEGAPLETLATRPRPEPSDPFELVFTSGTTGNPKGVVLTHANLLASLTRMIATVPERQHRLISILPLSHIMEQVGGLLFVLATGSSTEYLGSLRPDVFLAAMREGRVTAVVCVPQVLELLANGIDREAAKRGRAGLFATLRRVAGYLPAALRRRLFASVRSTLGGELLYIVSAAAYLPPALQRYWEALGYTVLQGYGTTECGLMTTTFPGRTPTGSVGYVLPPAELRIAASGEIEVRGPSVSSGYYQNPEATAAAFSADGWYRTGDAGRLESDGRLILIGRTRTMFVLPNGMNVFPEDIEAILGEEGFSEPVTFEAAPGRIEVAIIAGKALRDRPEPEGPALDAALKRANRRLGDHQRVAAWRAYPETDFPRTHTLKVKRAELTARLREAGEPER